jgi:two-component system sensor histidine kinase BaeS
MNIGITQRIFLAILAAALLSVVSLVVIMQQSLDRGFLRYVNTLEQTRLTRLVVSLEKEYALKGSWESLRDDPGQWRRLLAESLPEDERAEEDGTRKSDHPPVPPHLLRGFHQRVLLLDAGRHPVITPGTTGNLPELRPLWGGSAVVGYLGLLPRKQLADEGQRRFLREQNTAFVLVGGIILLLAAGFSLLLSSRLIRPLRSLARATDSLAGGRYDTRVAVTSRDELGQLARDFNALAFSLEKNEQARRGWVADISHELRTPLAVLRGEIEALQDGIRPLNRGAVDSLHTEVLRLGGLVDDLYQLALADVGALTYRKETLDLARFLAELAGHYRDDFAAAGLTLTLGLPEGANATVFADPARLEQLFGNLLDNSRKYTDPGGRSEIRLSCASDRVTVEIEDSAPGVGGEDLEKLFDRLYRVEGSRSRADGGAGLGLAICRTIAEAHEGSIIASHSRLGGLLLRVELPLWGGKA